MSTLKILFLNIILFYQTLSFKTKIGLDSGDFCLYKQIYRRDDNLVINVDLQPEDPDKASINLAVYLNDEEILMKSSLIKIRESIPIKNMAEYKICFKPIFKELISIEYSVNSKIEVGELNEIANKQAFDDVVKDLDELQDVVNKNKKAVEELSQKKSAHTKCKIPYLT